MSVTDVRPELFSAERSGEVAAGSFAAAPDPRLRQILQSLARYLHAFAKDVALTQSELDVAIDFLTRTGQMCDATRQEFVLLSDVLGLSMLVDALGNRGAGTATESTVVGPFHMTASPPRAYGEDIADVAGGEPTLVTGRVVGADGAPLPGAVIDVWQSDAEGFYDVQRPGVVPAGNLRGLFRCDPEGRFRFRAVLPVAYAIPADGPVGQLLAATGREPWRPAHLHVIATAPGHATLTTHLFVEGTAHLHSDAVFGVKESLIIPFRSVDDVDEADRLGMPAPCRHATVELQLRRN